MSFFLEVAKNLRKQKKGRKGRQSKRLGISGGYPYNAERDYSKIIKQIISEAMEKPIEIFLSSAQSNVRVIRDSVGDDIEQADSYLDFSINESIKKHYDEIQKAANLVDYASQRYFSKVAEKAIGTRFDVSSTNASNILKSWEKENLSLIKSASREQVKAIGHIVSNGVRDGVNLNQIKKDIMSKASNLTRQKAELIARDQIGNLNAALNKDRQQEAGLSLYYWRGMDDGREREGHLMLNDKLCRWDDATVYSADGGKTWVQKTGLMPFMHPGEDINCRCYAEAAIELELDMLLAE